MRRVATLLLSLLWAAPAFAQRLPAHVYDVSDGLPHVRVNALYEDRRGYLWVATPEGLGRFDGTQFRTYDTGDGLPHLLVNDIVEDRQGQLWVATNGGGIARLQDAGRTGMRPRDPRQDLAFVPVRVSADVEAANRVNALLFDVRNVAWCATDAGLYRGEEAVGGWRFTPALPHPETNALMPAWTNGRDEHWFGIEDRLVRVRGDEVREIELPGTGNLFGITWSPRDGLIVARERELYHRPHDDWAKLPIALGGQQRVRAIRVALGGVLWIATTDGLLAWDRIDLRRYGVANGLPDENIRALIEGSDGALWLGSWARGLVRFAPSGINSFTRADGLPDGMPVHVVAGLDGRVYVTAEPAGLAAIERDRVRPVPGDSPTFSVVRRRLFQDSRGRWWLATSDSIWMAPGPSLDLRQVRQLGAAHGLAGVSVPDAPGVIAEDEQGRIWIVAEPNLLYRSDPGGTQFIRVGALPNLYVRLASDGRGTMWMASLEQIGAVRGDTFEVREDLTGLPERRARALHFDRQGRFWVGLRFEGLAMSPATGSDGLTFSHVLTPSRLVSGTIWCIAEDARGRLYLGTGRGLDRYDPESETLTHLAAQHGLAGSLVNACTTDRRGHVWVATSAGISHIVPGGEAVRPPPPRIYVTALTVAGEERAVAERGLEDLPPLSFGPAMNNLRVEFTAVGLGRAPMRYQYRLDGASEEWSAPSADRAVNFARLRAGRYTLHARAVAPDGTVSATAAMLPFEVQPPIWQRWWVLLLAAAGVTALIVLAHRVRLRQALAMERIRSQIATDLHDEVGSGLSQIAVLNEVAKRDAPPAAVPLLDQAAGIARTLRESMSDIVWAVDPRKDRLLDLVQRMRQATFNLLEVDGLDVRFHAPPDQALGGIALLADRRRHLLLILKEAVTNIARHADATRACIDLQLRDGHVELIVEDDGRGLGAEPASGCGLRNMAARAAALGGTLSVGARPGGGTRVHLIAPLPRRRPRTIG
ncbi:MAG TPA: two-component regulator propeller domain-containing protein [Vicinamibacterales bacterium]